MIPLRQSTAVTFPFGPFIDDTDGKTAETALTISQADVRLSKNGGTYAQKSGASSLSHMENGYYGLDISTTDSNTVGHLRVAVNEAGALPVWADFIVIEEAVYDAMFAASAAGYATAANVTAVSDKIGTVENLGTGATIAKNIRDMAGPTFDSATDSQEDTRNRLVTVEAHVDTIPADVLAATIETGLTLLQAMRALSAFGFGKLAKSGTTWTFRNAQADNADRIVATVDATGRPSITLTL